MHSSALLYLLITSIHRLGISFFFAIYTIFLLSHGLSILETHIVNAAYFLTVTLCEAPTGAAADCFGRRKLFFISCLLYASGMGIYALSGSFLWFIIAEMVCAVGAACLSGALEAWMVDSVEEEDRESLLGRVFVYEEYGKHFITIAGALMGAALYQSSPSLPWVAGALLVLLAGIVGLIGMKESKLPHHHLAVKEKILLVKKTVTTSFIFIKDASEVRFLIILSILFFVAVQAPNMQWQPFFAPLVGGVEFGVLFAGIALALLLGATIASRYLKKRKARASGLLVCHFATGALLIVSGIIVSPAFALPVFLIHEIARGALEPIKRVYFNLHIPDAQRATLLSFDSMACRAGGFVGLLLSGVIAEWGSIPLAWICSGVLLLVVPIMFFLRK